MIYTLLVIITIVAIILFSHNNLLRERKRKINKRAKALGMEPVFSAEQLK